VEVNNKQNLNLEYDAVGIVLSPQPQHPQPPQNTNFASLLGEIFLLTIRPPQPPPPKSPQNTNFANFGPIWMKLGVEVNNEQ